jgi:hypothetical protein
VIFGRNDRHIRGVANSEDFVVGITAAPYPGHSSRPAKDRIHCRCSVKNAWGSELHSGWRSRERLSDVLSGACLLSKSIELKNPPATPAGLVFFDNLNSLRSPFSLPSPAVADESDGSDAEQGE